MALEKPKNDPHMLRIPKIFDLCHQILRLQFLYRGSTIYLIRTFLSVKETLENCFENLSWNITTCLQYRTDNWDRAGGNPALGFHLKEGNPTQGFHLHKVNGPDDICLFYWQKVLSAFSIERPCTSPYLPCPKFSKYDSKIFNGLLWNPIFEETLG